MFQENSKKNGGEGTYGNLIVNDNDKNIIYKKFKPDLFKRKFINNIKSLDECGLLNFEWLSNFNNDLINYKITHYDDLDFTNDIFDRSPFILHSFFIETICLLKLYPHENYNYVVEIIDIDFEEYKLKMLNYEYSIEHIKIEERCDAQFLIICYDILQAIKYIHSFDIIHADIKLENVLKVKNVEKYVLCDFSVSAFENGKLHYGPKTTWNYMSPEQFADIGYNKSADIWSFAVLCLTYYTKNQSYLDNINFELETIIKNIKDHLITVEEGYTKICDLHEQNLKFELLYINDVQIRNFISFMFVVDYNNRPTIEHCLKKFEQLYKNIRNINVEKIDNNNNNDVKIKKSNKQNRLKNWYQLYDQYNSNFFQIYNLNCYSTNFIFYNLFKFNKIKQLFIDLNHWSSLHNKLFEQFSFYSLQIYLSKITNFEKLTTSENYIKIVFEKVIKLYNIKENKLYENENENKNEHQTWIAELFEWVLVGLCKIICKLLDDYSINVDHLIYKKISMNFKYIINHDNNNVVVQLCKINRRNCYKLYYIFFKTLLNYIEYDFAQWIIASSINNVHNNNLIKNKKK